MSQTPRVALLSVGELFGGVERHLLGMCQWFRRQGTEPLLILFHDHELAAQARTSGFSPVILPSGGSFDPLVPGRLATLLRDRQVNLVHAHGYRAMVNAALARRKYSFALVRTVHGLVEPTKKLSVPWVKSHLYNWLEKTASQRTDATVCYVTEDLRQRRLGHDGGRTTLTVHNGIDPLAVEDFPRPYDLAEGVFNFAAVGRISPVKGLEVALQAMKRLDRSLPVVLNIIGTGPSTEAIKALAARWDLGPRVRFLGFKKNVYDYLAHVDALIMPSKHEGLPYTVLETMSLGTPIIASRVGGLAEVLDDGRTAVLLEPEDAPGWARAMAEMVADPGSARVLGQAGQEEQARSFTLDAMGQRYWLVYQETLMSWKKND